MGHKIKLIPGTYIDDQEVNPGLNHAEFYDMDGGQLRTLLENDGYKIDRNYNTGKCGVVITSEGIHISTSGWVSKIDNYKERE